MSTLYFSKRLQPKTLTVALSRFRFKRHRRGGECSCFLQQYCYRHPRHGPTLLPFTDHPHVTAVLLGHYPGQELGNALVDILYGDINPSGKLPYTIAYDELEYNGAPITAVNVTD
ncbi:putative beta-glucosidase g protein [Venturia nashicola]|uniref:beta-glucosidase n=1 Tax=Venturia nashicola TaxID=86259 RepID=A0A4Z1NJ53_9PEZI|nr:putative beta-glucosidase g protein [Venturia nashicola]TLD19034.1 putative beta-glucosidase g protein [Venturia nashicola]